MRIKFFEIKSIVMLLPSSSFCFKRKTYWRNSLLVTVVTSRTFGKENVKDFCLYSLHQLLFSWKIDMSRRHLNIEKYVSTPTLHFLFLALRLIQFLFKLHHQSAYRIGKLLFFKSVYNLFYFRRR